MRRLLALLLFLTLALSVMAQSKLGGSGKLGGTVKVGVQAGGGGGGTDFLTDTFTDTDTTILSSHTGELGATWTLHPTCTALITIQTNRAHKDTGAAASCYYASGTAPSGADYSIEGVMVDLTSENRSSRICGWMDTTAFSAVCVGRSNPTTLELGKYINGTFTQIDSLTITFTTDLSRTVKATRSGTSWEWFVDGASQGSHTISDTEVSGAGRVGIRQTGQWTTAPDTTYPLTSIRAFQ